MRTILTILVIFLAQCTYLHAKPKPGLGDMFGLSDSCVFGANSMSVYLYNSKIQGKNIEMNEISDNIDSSQPVVFIVHGFISSGNASSFQNLACQLVQQGCTVFVVDWSQGACTNGIPILKFTEYWGAVKNTREIGHLMANYTSVLMQKCDIPLEKITYIGHSLGAHVCGFAAKKIQEMGYDKIPLLIAADPASPSFKSNMCEERVCKYDAKRVVIFHTSVLGMSAPIGHLDLYCNKGTRQPTCNIMNVACSHTKSVEYISNMMVGCQFPAVPKNSISNSNTTVVNGDTLDKDNPMKGEYDVIVDKDSSCVKGTLTCTWK